MVALVCDMRHVPLPIMNLAYSWREAGDGIEYLKVRNCSVCSVERERGGESESGPFIIINATLSALQVC
jgi:hypothetical protein